MNHSPFFQLLCTSWLRRETGGSGWIFHIRCPRQQSTPDNSPEGRESEKKRPI